MESIGDGDLTRPSRRCKFGFPVTRSCPMKEVIFVVEEAPEGGFNARALGASIFTEADTLPQLREAVRDAVHCHFEADSSPKVIRLHFVRDEVLSA